MGRGGDGPVIKKDSNNDADSNNIAKEVVSALSYQIEMLIIVIKYSKVFIEGRYYDVSSLKHPGGSVINYYSGKEIDATEVFFNFHYRSKKAKILLSRLPSR